MDKPAEEIGTFPVVGIGASAGGLEAFTALLEALPANTGLAFVVIQHLDPKHQSALPELLARSTSMPVQEVCDGMSLESNNVYVMPANAGLTLTQRVFQLTPREVSASLRLPIDDFLRSLAQSHKHSAIAVILSGGGSDGSLGLEAIKAEGGIAFAQTEASAQFPDMPRYAVATGCVDFVLPPQEIARELTRIGTHPYISHSETAAAGDRPTPTNLGEFYKILEQATGVDFSLYRLSTVQRRIQRRQALCNAPTFEAYLKFLRENPAEVQALHQDLLIKVTQFFRDPEVFESLKRNVFPQLLNNRLPKEGLRFWVPGCSTGEEPYSLAMALLEFLEQNDKRFPIQIFASDINPTAIERARAGLYPENISADLTPKRLERFFASTDHGYRISKQIRDICMFAVHDLIKDPPFSHLDLISCRNVLIYMGTIQKRIIPLFHYALNPIGFLVLGPSESVNAFPNFFAAIDKKQKIYSRNEAAPVPLMHYPPLKQISNQADEAGGTETNGGKPSFGFTERLLLNKHGPARVIIDERLEVIEIGGDVSPYLELPKGKASLNLLKMVRGTALSMDLHQAFHRAKKEGAPFRKERTSVDDNGRSRDVAFELIPLSLHQSRTFLVFFYEAPPRPEELNTADEGTTTEERLLQEGRRQMFRLNEELAQAKLHLREMIEEHVSSGEQAQSDQEEAQSNIEELRSVNEELETAKEELHSANEELTTINEELQTRNLEISHSRDFERSIVETIGNPLLVLDMHLRVKTANPAFYQFFRAAPGTLEGQLLYQVDGSQWDIPDLRTLLGEVLPTNKFFNDFELERDWPKIGRKILLLSAHRLDHANMIFLSMIDITERKNAETTLRRTEDRLRQAQKLEAIGRLAGGVAHDFNNLLTGILGYSDLLLDAAGPTDPQREGLQEIKKSADRAAALTQQLLAFSRRQIVQPKVLAIDAVVADMDLMLRRLIGEHITLNIESDKPLGPVRADPGQVSQIIMNLSLNARDAMLHGGTLSIETRNVDLQESSSERDLEPGRYILLQVRDNGVGMDQETQAHLFEPFFSTKGQGLGTGLGLSTVYGIVEQSGARIHCVSELGRGTTFQIYFPRAEEISIRRQTAERTPDVGLNTLPRGSEVVLLVEDEEMVRKLARSFLENRGYQILEARHGVEALALCKDRPGLIDLLLTDIVMPEMGGRELAEKATPLYPKMKLLFMSGYTDDVLIREGIKTQDTPFLQKPFTLQELARKVREVLDAK